MLTTGKMSFEEYKYAIDAFSKGVKEKKYKAVSYDIWKKIVVAQVKNDEIYTFDIKLYRKLSELLGISEYRMEISYYLKDGTPLSFKTTLIEGADSVKSLFDFLINEFSYHYEEENKNDISSFTEKPKHKINDTYNKLVDCAALTSSNCTISSINTAVKNNDKSNFVSTVGNLTNAVDSSPIYVETQNSDISWVNTSSITKTEVDKMIQENNKIIENTLNPKVFNKEEKKENKMKGLNFDFGPCTNDNIRMSMYGLAVQNMDGVWVSYDPKTEQIIDVDILNFDGRKFMFKMPVAIKDVQIGDIIIHNHVPMFVVGTAGAALKAVDVREGERKEVIPVTNMFGFNFVTKVVSLFGKMEGNATPDAPFGNMLPLLMLQDGKNADNDAMFLFMMMQQGGNSMNLMSNPMMMYMLMKDDSKNSDLLPLMFMMNNMPQKEKVHTENSKIDETIEN